MPRKASAPASKSNYWEDFLKAQNLIGDITSQMEENTDLPTSTIRRAPAQPLTPDQWAFVFRVAERLSPIDGYTPEIKKRMMVQREEIRKSLQKVFLNEDEMTRWFNQIAIDFNLQDYELVQILYESLEGLKSRQAKELKKQLEGVYNQFVRIRTIGALG